jgi:threonine dehydratase
VRAVLQPTAEQSAAAWEVVRQHLPVTPVVMAPQLGGDIRLKIETVQPTGSFKVRGGMAAVAATMASDPGRAVVASSAGNHGLGLAYAASKLGADVTVVVPQHASAAKVSALQQFDVRLVLHGEGYSEAEARALEIMEEEGSRYVSPYNDPDVIAGQGTIARELLEQVPNLGSVVVPCGGGGLMAGVTLGLVGSGVRVVGVESEASPSVSTAISAGGVAPITVEPTLADGLAGNLELGTVTVDIALANHVEVVTVSEADIRSAISYAALKMGLVLEGAGAVGVAAVRAGLIAPAPNGGETVVLLTGRNIAPALFEEVLRA